jgi:hypothetical protein
MTRKLVHLALAATAVLGLAGVTSAVTSAAAPSAQVLADEPCCK